MESIWDDLSGVPRPDVIIMNSCLWDVSRYGPTSMDKYKVNLEKTFRAATDAMPPECLFIWNTALPVANKIRGGFLLPELDFLCSTLRLDVLEGNYYAKELAGVYGLDVLDLHYFFRYQLHRRAPDGVHWNHQAHRRITNLILTHVANAWGLDPPRHVDALNRSLPPAKEPRPATPPSIPDALNFIDFDKKVPGSSSSRPKLNSCPAALGKPPDNENEAKPSNGSSSTDQLVRNGPCKKANGRESSRPKSVDALSKAPTLDDHLKATANGSNSTGSHQSKSSAGTQSSLPGNNANARDSPIPSFTGNRPITPPCDSQSLLGSPPRTQAQPANRVAARPKKNTRFAPYNNNNNKGQPPHGEQINYRPDYGMVVQHQIDQYNFNVPVHFNYGYHHQYPPAGPQMGYGGQYQADLEWRRQQRMNRVMHDRGMEFNWFGGFNWG